MGSNRTWLDDQSSAACSEGSNDIFGYTDDDLKNWVNHAEVQQPEVSEPDVAVELPIENDRQMMTAKTLNVETK